MDALWKRTFKDMGDTAQTPRQIVQYQCEVLAKLTEEKVIARISEYHTPMERYLGQKYIHQSIFSKDKAGNPQSVLGDFEDMGSLGYEFYFTSKRTPNYKFRAFLMYHAVMLYPVTIFLEDGICTEIKGFTCDFIKAENEEEFTELLGRILNSERVTKIIENLLVLNKD